MPHVKDTQGRTALLVYYTCPDCETHWKEKWTCACDSECPNCGLEEIGADDWDELNEDPDEIDGGP